MKNVKDFVFEKKIVDKSFSFHGDIAYEVFYKNLASKLPTWGYRDKLDGGSHPDTFDKVSASEKKRKKEVIEAKLVFLDKENNKKEFMFIWELKRMIGAETTCSLKIEIGNKDMEVKDKDGKKYGKGEWNTSVSLNLKSEKGKEIKDSFFTRYLPFINWEKIYFDYLFKDYFDGIVAVANNDKKNIIEFIKKEFPSI